MTVHDVDTMTEFGNDLTEITEFLNGAFGSLLCLEIFTSGFFGCLNIYIGISGGINIIESSPKNFTFVFLFGFFFFLLGVLYLRRIKILSRKGSKLKQELEKAWTSLREISILKYSKMQENQIHDLACLNHRLYNLYAQGPIKPNDYFQLDSSLMTKFVISIICLISILIAIRSNTFVNTNQLICTNGTNF